MFSLEGGDFDEPLADVARDALYRGWAIQQGGVQLAEQGDRSWVEERYTGHSIESDYRTFVNVIDSVAGETMNFAAPTEPLLRALAIQTRTLRTFCLEKYPRKDVEYDVPVEAFQSHIKTKWKNLEVNRRRFQRISFIGAQCAVTHTVDLIMEPQDSSLQTWAIGYDFTRRTATPLYLEGDIEIESIEKV